MILKKNWNGADLEVLYNVCHNTCEDLRSLLKEYVSWIINWCYSCDIVYTGLMGNFGTLKMRADITPSSYTIISLWEWKAHQLFCPSLSLYLSLSPSFFLSISLSIYLSTLSFFPKLCLSNFFLSINLSLPHSFFPSLSIYLALYLPTLSISPSFFPSI